MPILASYATTICIRNFLKFLDGKCEMNIFTWQFKVRSCRWYLTILAVDADGFYLFTNGLFDSFQEIWRHEHCKRPLLKIQTRTRHKLFGSF